MSNKLTQYVIYTSGLKGLDNTKDWGIKWHSSLINGQDYEQKLEKFVSRLVRESSEIPKEGKIQTDEAGLFYILPHHDHLERISYFVVLLLNLGWSSEKTRDGEQQLLEILGHYRLQQKLEAFETSKTALDDQLLIKHQDITAVSSPICHQNNVDKTPQKQLPAKQSNPFTMVFIFIALLLISIIYYYHKPSVKVDELSCACYHDWWTSFYDQKLQLFEQWKKNQHITLQQCNQVCRWTGAKTEISHLLDEMTRNTQHWKMQHALMKNQGCHNQNLFASLNECSNGQFSQFFADLEVCNAVLCN